MTAHEPSSTPSLDRPRRQPRERGRGPYGYVRSSPDGSQVEIFRFRTLAEAKYSFARIVANDTGDEPPGAA